MAAQRIGLFYGLLGVPGGRYAYWALYLLVHCAYWECEKGVAFTGSPGSFGTLGSCRPVRGVLLPCLLCGLWELWVMGCRLRPGILRVFRGVSLCDSFEDILLDVREEQATTIHPLYREARASRISKWHIRKFIF